MKKQLYPSDSYNFPPLQWKNPAKGLTVTQASTCISYVFHVSMRKNDVTPSNIKDGGKDDITKRRQLISVVQFRQVNCCRIKHSFLPLAVIVTFSEILGLMELLFEI